MQVILAQWDDKEFALKVMSKQFLLGRSHLLSAALEKKMMTIGSGHPFITKLYGTMQSDVRPN